MSDYFTDRDQGSKPRNVDAIDSRVWGGIYQLIATRVLNGAFGCRFPEECQDGYMLIGCDTVAFQRVLAAEVPDITWPLAHDHVPPTSAIMDLLEFCIETVGKPIQGNYHPYHRHYHLTWDRDAGRTELIEDLNRLFARNGIAYQLSSDGKVSRILSEPLAKALSSASFRSGDDVTDKLLQAAKQAIASPKPEVRQDALEKLWDAFERLKTLTAGTGKKEQVQAMLDSVAYPGSKFRQKLEDESRTLTEIGNTFRIRHSETTQEALQSGAHVDYLFLRMLAFILLMMNPIQLS